MRKLGTLFAILFCNVFYSQNAGDVAVRLSASVQSGPPQIILSWAGNASSTGYTVYRKLKADTQWGASVAVLPSSTTQYTDNAVLIGENYEYRVIRTGSNYTGYGYLNSGIEVPETFYRGKVILIIDSTMMSPLSAEISRLITDMMGDGWEVIRHDVLRTASVKHVKSLIVSDYAIDTSLIKTVFLLGHVPVPYSGNINPDGHSDHLGAWPADCYYGDVDGVWTDLSISSTTNSPARTQNIPGDGKFDQSLIPTDLELQLGRVDFASMPSFSLTEEQLLKDYLDKDHDYRKKNYVPLNQGIMDDNFGYFGGEAFAASGYKSISSLVGSSNLSAGDYFGSMSTASYRWSYGCGGGSYTSASGIGNTGNFASANLQGVFTMLFGSYFGDWDCPNNFLRAALAQGKVLTNVWSGRPHYQFHHMGLGENIGYSLIMTQNNPNGLYFGSVTGITGRWIHNALMGDPTLRDHVVAPVDNVIATKQNFDCVISWSPSSDAGIAGYNIYAKNDTFPQFVKLNQSPVSTTTYTDHCLLYKGIYTYMVRAVKLEIVNSGSYYNMSEGLSDTAYNSSNFKTKAAFMASVSGNTLNLLNTSANASSYFWDLGNGQTFNDKEPVVTYSANGVYNIMLIAFNGCDKDTTYQQIVVSEVGIADELLSPDFGFYPSLCNGPLTLYAAGESPLKLEVYNLAGQQVFIKEGARGGDIFDLSALQPGVYLVKMGQGNALQNKKLVIE